MENREEMFARLADYGPTWEARAEHMVGEIVKKVDIATNFKRGVESISEADSETDIESKLNKQFEKAKSEFADEPQEVAMQLIEFTKVFDAKFKRFEELRDSGDTESDEFKQVWEELGELNKEGSELLNNEDAAFLWHLHRSLTGLLDKHQQVNQFKSDTKLIHQIVAEKLKQKPETIRQKLKGAEIVFQPFSANIILDKTAYSAIPWLRGSHGTHFSDTPINFIERGPNHETEETIKHENIHNLLDTVPGFGGHDLNRLTRYFKTLQGDEIDDQERQKLKETILEYTPEEVLNNLHNEMMAAVMSHEQTEFFKRGYFDITILGEGWDDFKRAVASFSTAGHEAEGIVELLKTNADEMSDPELKAYCESFGSKFKPLFVRAVKSFRQGLEVGERLGNDATFATEVFFYTVKPAHFQHISKFQKAKYGEAVVEQATRSAAIAKSFNLKADNLTTFQAELDKAPNILHEMDQAYIIDKLKRMLESSPDFLSRIGIKSLEDLRVYKSLLEKVTERFGLQNADEEYLEQLQKAFFFSEILDRAEQQFENLPEFYNQLSAQEKSIFIEVLNDTIKAEVPYYVGQAVGKELSFDDLKNQPLWKVLEDLGLLASIEKGQ